MADPEQAPSSIEDDEPEETPGYKAPAQKTLDEIQKLDADDESLVRYKQALLAGAAAGGSDDSAPNVVVEKLSLVITGRPTIDMDLTGDLEKLKDNPFTIKEGSEYRLQITFKVNKEIVAGLKFHQVTYRKGLKGLMVCFVSVDCHKLADHKTRHYNNTSIGNVVQHLSPSLLQYMHTMTVDKSTFMVGSYGPKSESHTYKTPIDEAPKGLLARGHYTVKSKFLDDDKNVHLEWEWAFGIKKDWE